MQSEGALRTMGARDLVLTSLKVITEIVLKLSNFCKLSINDIVNRLVKCIGVLANYVI